MNKVEHFQAHSGHGSKREREKASKHEYQKSVRTLINGKERKCFYEHLQHTRCKRRQKSVTQECDVLNALSLSNIACISSSMQMTSERRKTCEHEKFISVGNLTKFPCRIVCVCDVTHIPY